MFISNVNSGGSRHTDEDTNIAIFEKRKAFFKQLYESSRLPSHTKVIHVAGTKGKGSTVEFISAGLMSVSNRVGTFTSPHLHTARERIRINKELISKSDIARIADKVLRITEKHQWRVFFDMWLSSAIVYFGEQRCDYVVLETGIGGKFDSTNCFDATSVCVITSISMDHQNILGNTITAIATQKAGIIKPHSHVFTPSTQNPAALEVIRGRCAEMQATLHIVEVAR